VVSTEPVARVWLRAVRIHQWAKNLLLFLPALAAHRPPAVELGADLLTAFLSFSLLASGLYLLNDVVDRNHDRAHPTKRNRPVASGRISTVQASAVAVVLVLVSYALTFRLPANFTGAWASYLIVSAGYSFSLKRVVVLDVIILAGLYTVRVIAGAAAVDVALSRWFLAFSVFLFTSLALLKRMVETQGAAERETAQLAGRGWQVADAPVLLAFGAGAAVASALVYCLYITGDEVVDLYRRADMLWLGLPMLLYWIGRVWLLALRGEVHEDPLLFALRDRVSYLVLAIGAAVTWMAV
jgi:4-hydroxybenzoate polyprenyltransferase